MSRHNLIKVYRERRGLTQMGLADAAGLHWQTIARMERGEMTPTIPVARQIADALHASVDDVWPKEE